MPEKTIENLIRVEISKEFKIPVICPPSNRVTDNIASAIRQLIKEELEKRLPEEKKIELRSTAEFELRKQDEIYNQALTDCKTAIAEYLGEEK